MSFPAAIASSWIIVALAIWGVRLGKNEARTGVEPKGATAFVFVFCGLFVFFIVFQDSPSPFLQNVKSDLIGGLIGLGTAYFAFRFAVSRLQGRPRQQEPRR